ncbi:MAG: E3 binding domain-containing protein [Verrucomicrobiales bacterium]|nr:E3 binding domain-containing protein [Verrucomicrobiales bacterium]
MNERVEITVPRLGWTMEEGTFVGWLKKEGDRVRAGEPLFTLDGDKALQEIEAPESGILRIPSDAPKAGSTVRVGELLGYLVTSDALTVTARGSETAFARKEVSTERVEEVPAAPLAKLPAPAAPLSFHGERQSITPRARRKATELGIDWANLKGTGRGGRIRERDILAAHATDRASVQPGTVAITDWTFPDLAVELAILLPLGHEVVARQCKTEADLVALVASADCVITQFARLDANVIGSMTRARAIIRYGIGVDNVDLDAARAAGIAVCNVPDYCTDEVADQTLGFILGLTRHVVTHTKHVRDGKWGLAVPLAQMRTLKHMTVGVIGFGRIGREVVRRLMPFQCRILVFDPIVPSQSVAEAGAAAVSFDELLARADVVTLHCPSTPQTRRMLSREALARMKPGALLINAARGDLVDTEALVDALASGQIGGAALDVCECEPVPAGHRLLQFSNVILAPHIASASATAVKRLRETVSELAAIALSGKVPPNIVNGVTTLRILHRLVPPDAGRAVPE